MTERSIAHGSFTVERSFSHSPAVVFSAWSTPEFKREWFGTPEAGNPEHLFDFREGGREFNESRMGDDLYTFDVTYQDIVPDNRIVYTYQMKLNGQRISVSVATVELKPEGAGTKMIVREDGAFLDGLDAVAQREAGTNFLMDRLGASLERR